MPSKSASVALLAHMDQRIEERLRDVATVACDICDLMLRWRPGTVSGDQALAATCVAFTMMHMQRHFLQREVDGLMTEAEREIVARCGELQRRHSG